MADKSPRQHETKKSGKSIKQKRAEKKAGSSAPASVVPTRRPPDSA